MGQKRLNSLMLINVERDLTKVLDYEQVINSFADTQLLRNMLRYQTCCIVPKFTLIGI